MFTATVQYCNASLQHLMFTFHYNILLIRFSLEILSQLENNCFYSAIVTRNMGQELQHSTRTGLHYSFRHFYTFSLVKHFHNI